MSNEAKKHYRLAKLPHHIKLALLGVGMSSGGALAQDEGAENRSDEADETALEEIVVTGVRGSLRNTTLNPNPI